MAFIAQRRSSSGAEYGDFKICGLVGAAGKLSFSHEKAFKTMLILDTLRGIDSTGAVVVHRDGSHDVVKSLGNAFNLLESRAFDKAMTGSHSVLIGHNRYATQGKVSVRNAHPFEFSDIVGAHNGTLKNKYYLKDGHKFDVDSEALYSHINDLGVEDAIKGLDGAWALTWWNMEEGTLNFLRNKERPLYMSVAKEGQLFWASEPWMLEVALSREPNLEFTEPVLLPEDQWHKIQVNDDGSLSKPHVVPLASRFQPYVYQNSYNPQVRQHQTAVAQATSEAGGTKETSVAANAAAVIDTTRVANEIGTPYVYPRGKAVRLYVMGKGNDSQGGNYYICRDNTAPDRTIRLFINQDDRVELLNKYIVAEMHQFTVRDRFGLYYKVQHSTVRLAGEEKATRIDVTKEVVEEDQTSAGRFFHDSKGNLISETEWHKKHGTCDWCSGHVNPTMDFKFTTHGDVICHECAADSEVLKYVNVV